VWAEPHADELARHAVAYLNTDSNGRGFLGAEGSPSLSRLVSEVARDIDDPETRLTVWRRAHARDIASASSADKRAEARKRADLLVGALGSGSDYATFYDHLGVASLNLDFSGEDDGGIYHSIYDSFHWFTTFSDTAFVYGRALAQTAGTVVMRLADAELLPFEFTHLAERVQGDLGEVQDLLKATRDTIEERNRQIAESTLVAVDDPRRPTVMPAVEEVPPDLNFAPVQNGLRRLTSAADRYEEALSAASASGGGALAGVAIAEVNAMMLRTERLLAPPEGLPQRPWYRHLLAAPGWYTGYSPKTLPGIREAIEGKRWQESEAQAVVLGHALEEEAMLIERAAARLRAR
jgi:N-acetylated-alpha-linked acidic dipeptidase